jgi:hypothetical protein
MSQPPETISIKVELLRFRVTHPMQRHVIGGKGEVEISATDSGYLIAKHGESHYMTSAAELARSIDGAIKLQQEYAEMGGLYLLPVDCLMIKRLQEFVPGEMDEFIEICKEGEFKERGWDNPNNPSRIDCIRKLKKLGLL